MRSGLPGSAEDGGTWEEEPPHLGRCRRGGKRGSGMCSEVSLGKSKGWERTLLGAWV